MTGKLKRQKRACRRKQSLPRNGLCLGLAGRRYQDIVGHALFDRDTGVSDSPSLKTTWLKAGPELAMSLYGWGCAMAWKSVHRFLSAAGITHWCSAESCSCLSNGDTAGRLYTLEQEVKALKRDKADFQRTIDSLRRAVYKRHMDSAAAPPGCPEVPTSLACPAPPPPPPLPRHLLQPVKMPVVQPKEPSMKSRVLPMNLVKTQPVVTAADLQRVQLRRVDGLGGCIKKDGDEQRAQSVKTPCRLRGDSMLISQQMLDAISSRAKDVRPVRFSISEEARHYSHRSPKRVEHLKRLRTVHMTRSPGGTPLSKSLYSSGSGLTPLLTTALQRKFKQARSPSPSTAEDGGVLSN